MTPRHFLELLALGATWGFSFIFLRIAVPALGASTVTFLRLSLAVCLLGAVVKVMGVNVPWKTHWRAFAIFGLINTAVPFLLFGLAAKFLPAGYLAILNGTAALFSATIAVVWFKQALTLPKVLGLVLGLCGVIVLVGLAPVTITPQVMGAIAAGLVAALFYAIAGNLTARILGGISPYAIAFASLVPASLALLPIACSNLPAAQNITPKVAFAVLFLGLITTGLAYLMYFRLMAAIGVVRVSTVAFLIPMFALIWGWLFIDEPITQANIIGGACVLIGVALVNGLIAGKKSP